MAQFGKQYKDEEEFQRRLAIFEMNYLFVENFNALPAEETEGIVLKINQFSDMEENEFLKSNTGIIVPKERSEKMRNFSFSQ